MLLKRYLLLETIKTFLLIVVVLLLIAISYRFTQLLTRAAAGDFPISAIVQVVMLIIPELFREIATIASFAAVLITHSKMHANSEIRAMQALGASKAILITPTVQVMTTVALIVLTINIWVVPELNTVRNQVARKQQVVAIKQMFKPQEFHAIKQGKLIIYVDKYTKDNNLENVFIYFNQPDVTANNNTKAVNILMARYATLMITDVGTTLLKLFDGNKYLVANNELTKVSFKEYFSYLTFDQKRLFELPEKTTTELWHSKNLADKVELQYRIWMPLNILVLTLLAIPLAVMNPRSLKYHMVLTGIAVFFGYYIIFITWQKFLLQALIPQYLGLWTLPIIGLIVAYYRLSKMR